MDYKVFFDKIRPNFTLTTINVSGFEYLLQEGEKRKVTLDEMSYVLATVWHETAHTMKPVREYGGETYLKGKKYYPYVGMGYVQLTWKENYEKATKYFRNILKINVDFVKDPKLLLKKEYAAIILIVGMQEGWFTGKKLSDYIKGNIRNYKEARRIINGTDKATLIANYADKFRVALISAQYDTEKPIQNDQTIPSTTQPSKSKTSLWAIIIDLMNKIFGGKK